MPVERKPRNRLARSIVPAGRRPRRYLAGLVLTTVLGIAGVVYGNQKFAPEMYSHDGPIAIGNGLAAGKNFANFDLNLNIREIRDAQIARMERAPEVVILGASHWQEAHVGLLPHKSFYNAHIHRDYWEDMLGMVEILVRHNKLPRQMIISIRDLQFSAVGDRKDHLWLPGAPYARAMAERLGLEPLTQWETMPVPRWREMLSISMLYGNVVRYFKAPEKPQMTTRRFFDRLDAVLPGGSIIWSDEHQRIFTRERAERLALGFAANNAKSALQIDRRGVSAIDTLLGFLKSRNVEVFLAHPPFNPLYFDRVKNTPYMASLHQIEQITQRFADKHGLKVIGSFDPAKVGCTADQYIDAEHANPACLIHIFDEFTAVDAALREKNVAPPAITAVTAPARTEGALVVAAPVAMSAADAATAMAAVDTAAPTLAPAVAVSPPEPALPRPARTAVQGPAKAAKAKTSARPASAAHNHGGH